MAASSRIGLDNGTRSDKKKRGFEWRLFLVDHGSFVFDAFEFGERDEVCPAARGGE